MTQRVVTVLLLTAVLLTGTLLVARASPSNRPGNPQG